MKATSEHSFWSRILTSLGKLWLTRDEISFAQIRPAHLAYMLPMTILLILHDLRSTYFITGNVFMGLDMTLLAYIAFAVGAIAVLLLAMKKVIGGMRVMTAIIVAGFALWLLLPEGYIKNAAMLVFHFGVGGATIYATFAHVFVLKNAERLFSMCIVALVYGLFTFLYHSGVSGSALSKVFPGLLVVTLALCVLLIRQEAFSDHSSAAPIVPHRGIYIILLFPFAFFAIDVFGENLVNHCLPGDIALRGIGTMAAVLLAVIIQFGFRRSVWYMMNLFLIFTTAGILMLALPLGEQWRSIGCLLFGIGDGVGYIMVFYIVGFMKKYRNHQLFWRITFATIGAIFLSVLAESIISLTGPEVMPVVAIIVPVAFLLAFQILPPVIQRNIFAADWNDDLKKSDVDFKLERKSNRFEYLGFSPHERNVIDSLLRGMSARQIAGTLGLEESEPGETPEQANAANNLLTTREMGIALLLTEGLSQYEISRKLNITSGEVGAHIKTIREKVGVLGDPDPVISTVVVGYKLTKRETDMLRCLIKRMTNNEIAAELLISEETVKIHVRNLMKKLNLKSRFNISEWLEAFKTEKEIDG